MRNLRADEIGGGVVRRKFQSAGGWIMSGTNYTGDELRAMPRANRDALIQNGFLEVWPKQSGLAAAAAAAVLSAPATEPAERYVLPVDGGFDVLEGRKLNVEPIKKKGDAMKLASTGVLPAADAPTN